MGEWITPSCGEPGPLICRFVGFSSEWGIGIDPVLIAHVTSAWVFEEGKGMEGMEGMKKQGREYTMDRACLQVGVCSATRRHQTTSWINKQTILEHKDIE